jgi:2-keto-4-pentenoate hydratase
MSGEAATGVALDDAQVIDRLARRLDEAWCSGETITPPSESEGLARVEDAYAVQSRWTALRLARGERVIGRKIGLTSQAMRDQLGVDEPDYGSLWSSRHYVALDGHARMPHDVFIQPRMEGELAFLLGRELPRCDVRPAQVLAATEAIAVSVEVIDSRIENWRIALADTIADNASYGAVTLGPWSRRLLDVDLSAIGMRISRDGVTLVEGVGAASMGDPTRAVAWLANKLGSFGLGLQAGDVVLSGSLSSAIAVRRGDALTVEMSDQPPLTVSFE